VVVVVVAAGEVGMGDVPPTEEERSQPTRKRERMRMINRE
jgi:hypothetical protein